jgi:GNAT superfamily N-acetyltransferase
MVEAHTAGRADVRPLAGVLARAFEDDPVWAYVFPAERSRLRRLHHVMAVEVKRALRLGEVHWAGVDGDRHGAAVWIRPGKWRVTGLELARQLPLLVDFATRLRPAISLMNRIERVHPREPHWYLAALGTEPGRQGRGIGTAAMAPVLERCDREGVAAYLESSKHVNIPLYERHGFEVTGEIVVPDGPTLWSMWRTPRAPQPTS